MQEMYEDAGQVATDSVGSIRTVVSFSAEKRVVTTYNKKCEALRKHGVRSGIVGGLGFGFSLLVLYLTYALCFYVGAQFVHQGKMAFSDVFKVRIPKSFQDCLKKKDFKLPFMYGTIHINLP